MKFKNIAVAFITNKLNDRSFSIGLTLAKQFEGEITVIDCVYKKPPKFVFFETKEDKRKAESIKKEAKKYLEKFEEMAKEQEIPIKTKVAHTDSIPEWILDYIKDHKADLLIIDHPHLTEFEQTYYDDMIQKISHKIKIPLLMLRS